MKVDLSRQEAELIIRRFTESVQLDIDEQLLSKRLRQYFPEPNTMRHFRQEPARPMTVADIGLD